MTVIRFVIPGPAATQGSLTSYGRGRVAHPPKLVAWRALAVTVMTAHKPIPVFTGPVTVRLWATYTRPKSHLLKNGKPRPAALDAIPRADLDKTCRACGDALQAAGVLLDDNQITRWEAVKRWAYGEYERARAIVEIEGALA